MASGQAIHSGVVLAAEAVSYIPQVSLVRAASSVHAMTDDGRDGRVINCPPFKMICQVCLCALPQFLSCFPMETDHCNIN